MPCGCTPTEPSSRTWKTPDVKMIAAAVGDDPGFQQRDGYSLSAAEVFAILSQYRRRARRRPRGSRDRISEQSAWPEQPGSFARRSGDGREAEQFLRTTADVADSIHVHGRIPPAVWLGSQPFRRRLFCGRWRWWLWIWPTAKPIAEIDRDQAGPVWRRRNMLQTTIRTFGNG